MSNLSDQVESLKRVVAAPGGFAALFPETNDDGLLGLLQDGFAEAQLDGFFGGPSPYALNLNTGQVAPDLNVAQSYLVVLYAGARLVQARLLNLKSRVHYQSGTTIYETEQAASVLTALLKSFMERKTAILLRAQATSGAGSFFDMSDAYFLKATGTYRYATDALAVGHGSGA